MSLVYAACASVLTLALLPTVVGSGQANPTRGRACDNLRESKPPPEAVVLGWFGPSDPDDPLWGTVWQAASLAIRHANAEGGYEGRPFRLVPVWSDNRWGTGVADLFHFIYEQQPSVVIGSIDGPATHLAEQVVAKARVPLISPLTTDSSVTLAGVPWVFATAPSDHHLAKIVSRDLEQRFPHAGDAFCVMSCTDHDARLATTQLLQTLAERRWFPRAHWTVQTNTDTSATQLRQLAENPPELLLLLADTDDTARWLRELRGLKLPTHLVTWHAAGRRRFLELAGEAAEGIYFPLLTWASKPRSESTDAIGRLQANLRCVPDYADTLVQGTIQLVIEAIREAGLEPEGLRQALLRAGDGDHGFGALRWDSHGRNQAATVVMATIKNGEIVSASPGNSPRTPYESIADQTDSYGSVAQPHPGQFRKSMVQRLKACSTAPCGCP